MQFFSTISLALALMSGTAQSLAVEPFGSAIESRQQWGQCKADGDCGSGFQCCTTRCIFGSCPGSRDGTCDRNSECANGGVCRNGACTGNGNKGGGGKGGGKGCPGNGHDDDD
ncbi:hypothetical protein J7T55_007682 [Diaporthe amygdali]|uniref:uncharacterized protein n=1 Tax=Phomopsis amygdali TaxID=1214568 RepID=UPI0022FEE6CC|nr:uncharacterized protein J7T55_007682 [Diaporthe amygdali]KAJ0107493.1 hypothetical protein J7T55_007682 [Diaporthe amygdali]